MFWLQHLRIFAFKIETIEIVWYMGIAAGLLYLLCIIWGGVVISDYIRAYRFETRNRIWTWTMLKYLLFAIFVNIIDPIIVTIIAIQFHWGAFIGIMVVFLIVSGVWRGEEERPIFGWTNSILDYAHSVNLYKLKKKNRKEKYDKFLSINYEIK